MSRVPLNVPAGVEQLDNAKLRGVACKREGGKQYLVFLVSCALQQAQAA
jgi:hypothetical protein